MGGGDEDAKRTLQWTGLDRRASDAPPSNIYFIINVLSQLTAYKKGVLSVKQ